MEKLNLLSMKKAKCQPNYTLLNSKNFYAQTSKLNLYFIEKFPVTIFRLFQVYGPKQDKNRILPYIIKKLPKK